MFVDRNSRKSGLTDFRDWYRKSFGRHSPWGDQDSPALVTAVETALERSLSVQLMQGAAKPTVRRVKAGEVLVRQGDPGTDVYLVLDGVLRVDRDGQRHHMSFVRGKTTKKLAVMGKAKGQGKSSTAGANSRRTLSPETLIAAIWIPARAKTAVNAVREGATRAARLAAAPLLAG